MEEKMKFEWERKNSKNGQKPIYRFQEIAQKTLKVIRDNNGEIFEREFSVGQRFLTHKGLPVTMTGLNPKGATKESGYYIPVREITTNGLGKITDLSAQNQIDLLYWAEEEFKVPHEVSDDDSDISLEDAYTKAEVKIRLGQDRFRKNVEKVWKGKQCAVTGINYEPLLIASHVVRFSECLPGEHWDGANGMFLTAHLDALFDKYLITFIKKEFGFKIKWSKHVDKTALYELNIKGHEVLNTKVLRHEDHLKFEEYMLKHNEAFNSKNK
jgi:hypothetical protein